MRGRRRTTIFPTLGPCFGGRSMGVPYGTVTTPGGPGKAKCWFEFLKKCLERESNPSSPVCRASMLTIRPWRFGWLGRANTVLRCCCLLRLDGLPPSRFYCLRREVTRMDGARDKALVFFLSCGRTFDSVPWWSFCPKHVLSTGVNSLGGESIGWTISKV